MTSHRFTPLLFVLAVTGCWSEAAPPTFPSKAAADWSSKPARDARAKAAGDEEEVAGAALACEVRLDVETDDRRLVSIEKADAQKGTCIKWKGRPLEIPESIWLTSGNLMRYTTEESFSVIVPLGKRNLTSLCAGVSKETPNVCQWSGVYRQKYPMSFTLRTEDRIAPLADYVSLVRVYHNGTKVFAWSDTSDEAVVHVPSGALYNGREPYDTAIDLHVAPSGVEVDVAKLEAGLAEARRPWMEQVAGAALETLKADVLKGTPLEKSLGCFEGRLKDLAYEASRLVEVTKGGSAGAPPAMPEDCSRLPLPETGFAKAYEKLKSEAFAEAKKTKEAALAELAKHSKEASKAAGDALTALHADYEKWKAAQTEELAKAKETAATRERDKAPADKLKEAYAEIAKLENGLREADRVMDQATKVADKAVAATIAGEATIRAALDAAVALGKDSKKQAEIFAEFTHRLEDAGGPFDPRRDNPMPVEGVSVLQMKYEDVFQTYGFGPWSGVPVRLQHTDEAKFAATTVVPILDVGGMRWQWGTERMKEVRLAAGIMYYADDRLETNKAGETKEVEAQRFGTQVNASLGGFRFGVAVPVDGWDDLKQETRLVLGADLYKLITGENLEAL